MLICSPHRYLLLIINPWNKSFSNHLMTIAITNSSGVTKLRIETILNKCQRFKSFVYTKVWFSKHNGHECIEAEIHPRKNSKAICSYCHKPASVYDRLNLRRFEFVPLWGYPVFFLYQMRRINCKQCGVVVEQVPWSTGKHTLTSAYMKFHADWGKKNSLGWNGKKF